MYAMGLKDNAETAQIRDGSSWLSFMRGVVESAIRGMSAEERQSALREVTGQVVAMMGPDERIDALAALIRELAQGVSPEDIAEAISRAGSG
jgi:hypothetical protein